LRFAEDLKNLISMRLIVLVFIFSVNLVWAQKTKPKTEVVYYPGSDSEWKKKKPAEAGIDEGKLKEAIAFSISHESKSPHDQETGHYQSRTTMMNTADVA